jgi:integrase
LREKKLSGGGVSFYLDISHEGRRWYEFLNIRLKGSRRDPENLEKKKLADKARSVREYQLTVEKVSLPDETKKERDMLAYISEKSAGMRSSSAPVQLRKKLETFTGWTELPMSKIDKSFLLRFQEFLKADGLSQGTIYTLVHRFSTFLYKAVEEGHIAANPYQKIPRSERVKQKRPTPAYLTTDEIERLASKNKGVHPQLRQAFLFSCFTGLRWSDCSRLKWSQITKQTIEGKAVHIMRIDQQKTEQGTYLPMSAQAVMLLEQRRKDAKDEPESLYVFPYLYEPFPKTSKRAWMTVKLKDWAKVAGIEQNLHFHLARHTFATLALSEGADLYTVSKLLGHADFKNTQIYAHVVNRLKLEAVARLPKLKIRNLNSEQNPKRKAG